MPTDQQFKKHDPNWDVIRRKWEAHYLAKGVNPRRISELVDRKMNRR